MDVEGHWGNGLSSPQKKNILLVHLWYFVQFIRELRGAKKEKGHPLHVWLVIIFLMTVVSSGNVAWIHWIPNKGRGGGGRVLGAAKDLFRDMFYVKKLGQC